MTFVHRQRQRTTDERCYLFVIARAVDDRPLGTIGLWVREVPEGRATLGYWVVKSVRGDGAASTALLTVSTWASDDLRIPRLQLFVEPWNTTSCRTTEEAGYIREDLLCSWQKVGAERRDMYVYALTGIEPTDPYPVPFPCPPRVQEAGRYGCPACSKRYAPDE